jgi:hypothetical protein
MASKIFTLGIFTMAAACGVIGFQALTYYFYSRWPMVSFHYVYSALFGDFPVMGWQWENDLLRWTGKLPVSVVGIAISYLLLFIADLLRVSPGR